MLGKQSLNCNNAYPWYNYRMAKISEETKVKLVYSGELFVISIVFLVLGILKITGVMGYDETRRIIFNYITIAGGIWILIDFIWCLVSPKRRAKNCLLDKILNLPLGIYLLTFDILCLINGENYEQSFFVYGICIAFFYVTINYMFQSIYHYFKPLPMLMEEIEKTKENENNSQE